ncbi:hypothetical protein ENH_00004420 [Eimeria necatrix]|uniref:Uncharacterized protein n=1 Tax=Eimeria necatrix TaxID=51315 RepID=U6MKD6_9EIME|nr:hypothetical protein ENH_00004420 [Eimeria necatrix]CDJ62100.1 hypothetical protein ENH_00004420 [Eimeria necatrix]
MLRMTSPGCPQGDLSEGNPGEEVSREISSGASGFLEQLEWKHHEDSGSSYGDLSHRYEDILRALEPEPA